MPEGLMRERSGDGITQGSLGPATESVKAGETDSVRRSV